jgi:hypothetical protein
MSRFTASRFLAARAAEEGAVVKETVASGKLPAYSATSLTLA